MYARAGPTRTSFGQRHLHRDSLYRGYIRIKPGVKNMVKKAIISSLYQHDILKRS
jgi:hypothetical protein